MELEGDEREAGSPLCGTLCQPGKWEIIKRGGDSADV